MPHTTHSKVAAIMTMGAVIAALVVSSGGSALAATVTGGDKGGADVVLSDGDVVSGTFTNVGEFVVPAGATVDVEPGTPLVVEADVITIDGVLDGTGAGSAGGEPEATGATNGNAGEGDGAGGGGTFGGCVHGGGGGGGGYGGVGGKGAQDFADDSATPGAGGATYGTADGDDIASGSGGGSGPNHCEGSETLWQGGEGGAGGASITLRGGEIHIEGSILADGADAPDMSTDLDYGAAAGGGGSGGGVLLEGTLYLHGTISATGGDGGDTSDSGQDAEDEYANGGGGGGGGRIKLRGEAESGPTFDMLVDAGALGVGTGTNQEDDTPALPGADGTIDADIVGIPVVAPTEQPAAVPVEAAPNLTG